MYELMYLIAMAMAQRPVGFDVKILQQNMGLNYQLSILKHLCITNA